MLTPAFARSRLALRPGWRTSVDYFFEGLWPDLLGGYGPEALYDSPHWYASPVGKPSVNK